MKTENRSVCVAVLQYIDGRCSSGYRPKSFYKKQEFMDFLAVCHGMIYSDETLVVLQGGGHEITTLDAVSRMDWML